MRGLQAISGNIYLILRIDLWNSEDCKAVHSLALIDFADRQRVDRVIPMSQAKDETRNAGVSARPHKQRNQGSVPGAHTRNAGDPRSTDEAFVQERPVRVGWVFQSPLTPEC